LSAKTFEVEMNKKTIHVDLTEIVVSLRYKYPILGNLTQSQNMVSNSSKWEAVVINAIVILNNILMDTIYRTSVNVYD
jgi:hypothetical protein